MWKWRGVSLTLGTLSVMAGAAFLWNVGAVPGMPSRNIIAYLVGLLLGSTSHKIAHRQYGAAALFALSCLILALVILVGTELDGVRRWIPLGPVHIQPALVLSPLLLAIGASKEGRHWRAAILVPLILVALQPDAATMVALAAGVAAMMVGASIRSKRGWSHRRIAIAGAAVALAVLGLLLLGVRTPPPVAFVEGTIGIAALSGTPAMILHFVALALMVAALFCRFGPTELALNAYFTVATIAAIFWAFPTPIVGAGPSHLIGFGIAIGWLTLSVRGSASRPKSDPA